MKTFKSKMDGKAVTVIALDSMTKEETKIIYNFLGASLYPHSTYYILGFTDKKVVDALRDAMLKSIYNKPSFVIKTMACTSINDMINLWEGNEFDFISL